MGSVYRAERADEVFEKEVAIKVVRRGLDLDYMVRHFRLERQIMASLEHPNIARLLDGGATPDGLPYFVMEFIRGKPVDVYCEERHLGAAASGWNCSARSAPRSISRTASAWCIATSSRATSW